jgi:hypothetical protein
VSQIVDLAGARAESERIKAMRDLKHGGGSGTSDGMDRVWEKLGDHDKRFDKVEAKVDKIGSDLAEVKGRLSAMPTTWQLLGMILAIMGASFAIVRFGLGKI